MAVTLAQSAATEPDLFRRGAQEVASVLPVWDRLRWEPVAGNAYAYSKDKVLPGTAFRTVNEAYVESTGLVNQDTENIVILGGDADVDRFIEKTRTANREVLLAGQIKMKIESAHRTYVNEMFNGDVVVNPKGFDGLRKRLVGKQVLDSAVAVTNSAFLSELDLLLGLVPNADAIYTTAEVLARVKGLGRQVGGAEYVMNEITGKREFTWNGVPFVDPGEHWDGSKILSHDATNGSDMYAVKFADSMESEGVLGITNGGLQAYEVGELQEKPAYRARVEFYAGLVAQGGHAAARLRGIKLT